MTKHPKHEREIRFEFGNEIGYIDGKLNDYVIVENKCKARWTIHDIHTLPLDGQCTAYISAWNHLTAIPVDEITLQYHVALKPAIRQKKDESDNEFLIRLADACDESRHTVQLVTREQWQIDEYRRFMIQVEKEMNEAVEFPMNSNACTMYGTCEFAPICLSSPENRNDVIKHKYRKKEKRSG
jgi:hypothetical protein